MSYESLIDWTQFANVRRYLTPWQGERYYALFVNSEQMLVELALLLDETNGRTQWRGRFNGVPCCEAVKCVPVCRTPALVSIYRKSPMTLPAGC